MLACCVWFCLLHAAFTTAAAVSLVQNQKQKASTIVRMMFPLLQSLIVRSHCKLELWDDDDGIDNGAPPDLVLDNTVRSHI